MIKFSTISYNGYKEKRKLPLVRLLVIGILLVSLTALFLLRNTGNPIKIIEEKFGIKIPATVEVVKYEYNKMKGYFAAKLSISSDISDILTDEFTKHFKAEYYDYYNDAPNYSDLIKWWDLDTENIIVCFYDLESDNTRLFWTSNKSIEVWVIISRENNQYYMYIFI
jgi:hypothetical protein